jgi:peptidoglycan/LPS O-acetylase OafA/YrhL
MSKRSNAVAAGRLVSLDGLRGIAVLTIVLFHAEIPGMTNGGYFTLDIFFVLSGFLITGVLLGEREAKGRVRLGRFYYRRFLRLYPALLVMILLLMPFGRDIALYGHYSRWLRDALLSITYTIDLPTYWGETTMGGLAHTWSLAIEEQFYLLWAPILVVVMRKRMPGLKVVAWVMAVAVALYLLSWFVHQPWPNSATVYGRPDLRFAEVLIGCSMSIALTALPRPLPGWLERAIPWIGNVSALGIVLMVIFIPEPFSIRISTFLILLPFAAFGAAGVILRLSHRDDGVVAWVLKKRLFTFTGDISYGIYLWHLPIIILLRPQIPNVWLRGAIVIALTYVAAYTSRRVVENPFLRLKDRLRTTGVTGIDAAPEEALVEQPHEPSELGRERVAAG